MVSIEVLLQLPRQLELLTAVLRERDQRRQRLRHVLQLRRHVLLRVGERRAQPATETGELEHSKISILVYHLQHQLIIRNGITSRKKYFFYFKTTREITMYII